MSAMRDSFIVGSRKSLSMIVGNFFKRWVTFGASCWPA